MFMDIWISDTGTSVLSSGSKFPLFRDSCTVALFPVHVQDSKTMLTVLYIIFM